MPRQCTKVDSVCIRSVDGSCIWCARAMPADPLLADVARHALRSAREAVGLPAERSAYEQRLAEREAAGMTLDEAMTLEVRARREQRRLRNLRTALELIASRSPSLDYAKVMAREALRLDTEALTQTEGNPRNHGSEENRRAVPGSETPRRPGDRED